MVNARPIFPGSKHWLMVLALALTLAPGQAAPIRVTTWDLRPGSIVGTNSLSKEFQQGLIKEAAQSLKKLRPDVIVLQEVSGWETCRQLTQALQPEIYYVAICSTFRDPAGKPLGGQVAIISKAKAYLTWSTPWQRGGASPALAGGYAFAALRLGDRNVGVFSVQFGENNSSSAEDSQSAQSQAARAESALQLLQQIASLQSWQENRPQTIIVAGDFNTMRDDGRLANEKTLSLLEQTGFDDAFAGCALEKRITRPGDALHPAATLDYIFTRTAGLVGPAMTTPSPLWEHAPVTSEMDFAKPKATPPPPPAPPAVVVKTPPTPPPSFAPKPTPTPTLAAASNNPPAPPPMVTSNAATVRPVIASSNGAAIPLPQTASMDSPPLKPAAKTTNLPPAPPALATAATPAANTQALVWLATFLGAGLVLFLVARRLLRQSEIAPIPATASDLQRSIAGSISVAQDDSIILAPPPSPPYVRIEMEGSMQTQSQTWPPRPADERLAARLPEPVRASVIANLSRWLKEKAVQRLVSDRARLLATQQAAGLAVLAVDQRLAKIEHQIKQINHDYEQRIDELLKELIAAKEENRELIRAKIALVKAEMEKARLRAAQPAPEHQQY
jgi:endonuclease/exonuclease/phosphatase (EEP) superfamily protein YafD